MRIVLDTAALIAAIRSPAGASGEVVRRILKEEITLLMDYKISLEYREVALRNQHAAPSRTLHQIDHLLAALENVAEPIPFVQLLRPSSTDANDDMILELACSGKADAIVTHNEKHFRSAPEHGLKVCTPRQLLNLIREGDHNAD